MEKKTKDQVKTNLQEEIVSLKRQLAGSKGRNKQLIEDMRGLKNKFLNLSDALTVANEQIANQKLELSEKSIKITHYKAIIEWYNGLSWWKRLFVKKIVD